MLHSDMPRSLAWVAQELEAMNQSYEQIVLGLRH